MPAETNPNPAPPQAAAPTQNVRVSGFDTLPSPGALTDELPLTDTARDTVLRGRRDIENILTRNDDRFLVVVGPCSIHDPAAALEYAQRLAELAKQVADRMLIVMRVYFEKPRTTVGWKGLINDPNLDGTFDIARGLRLARRLLLQVNELGLPAGTEFRDPITPQYLDDLIAWAAIGARTTESQTHRQMASGLSMPVGFKNATTGDVQVALDAMQSAMSAHHFVGIDEDGRSSVVHTTGNAFGHVILRGGHDATNYEPADIAEAAQRLEKASLNPVLLVDCSHANSGKKAERQEAVWNSLVEQRKTGTTAILGAMIESNLEEGNQKLPADFRAGDLTKLQHGVSITDACMDWETTRRLIEEGWRRLYATG
ncbi:MAG: 3-deoxy-7-phosphoheptulonate synthase [Planctomycetota bacterium]